MTMQLVCTVCGTNYVSVLDLYQAEPLIGNITYSMASFFELLQKAAGYYVKFTVNMEIENV